MNYFRPEELSQALTWLADNNAGIAAGCTDLLAATDSQYLSKPGKTNLLDITAIAELTGITSTSKGISIGGATRWSEIIAFDLPPAFSGLKAAAREVGSIQIQNTGTIGGNLCNASPAADGVPPLLTLDASVKLESNSGSRFMPLSQFILGPRQTALEDNEILVSIEIPNSALSGKSAFIKLGARKYLVISIAMVAVRLELEEGVIVDIAICVGSCSAVAKRMESIELALIGRKIDQDIQSQFDPAIIYGNLKRDLSPIDDIRADANYRINAAGELIIRAINQITHEGNSQ